MTFILSELIIIMFLVFFLSFVLFFTSAVILLKKVYAREMDVSKKLGIETRLENPFPNIGLTLLWSDIFKEKVNPWEDKDDFNI